MDTARPGPFSTGPFSVADVKPYAVPARLDDLQGPVHGIVTLPRDVAWSGRREAEPVSGASGPSAVGEPLPRTPPRLMDAFQERLARIALDVVGNRGFVLGGGHAVQLHGMAARPSEVIDLFGADRGRPAEVEADVVAAFRGRQFTVTVTRRTSDLVQMMVSGLPGETSGAEVRRQRTAGSRRTKQPDAGQRTTVGNPPTAD